MMSANAIASAGPENGLVSKIDNLSVSSNGEQQPLPTSPNSSGEFKDGGLPDDSVAAAERSLLQKVIRKGLVENKNDLEIQRKDPKSPLYSVKSFEALNLKPQLLKGVYSMGKIFICVNLNPAYQSCHYFYLSYNKNSYLQSL